MKTINLVLLCLAMLVSTVLTAQKSVVPDQRLKQIYSDEELARMNANSNTTIEYLNFCLQRSWFLADESVMEKVQNSPYLYYVNQETGLKSDIMVTSVNFENFNVLLYYSEPAYDKRVFYRIGDTGYVIGFYSVKELAEMYNNEKNQ